MVATANHSLTPRRARRWRDHRGGEVGQPAADFPCGRSVHARRPGAGHRLPGTRDKVLTRRSARPASGSRRWASALIGERRVTHDPRHRGRAPGTQLGGLRHLPDRWRLGDRRPHDVVRRHRGGGRQGHAFGMRSIPATCLLTAELDGKPVLGLPGCAKSPKYNGFDWF